MIPTRAMTHKAKSAVIDNLQTVRELLADESRWIKGHAALRTDGTPLADGFDEGAVCWCLTGAVDKVAVETGGYELATLVALDHVNPESHQRGRSEVDISEAIKDLTIYNDARDTAHTDILALIDRAIEDTEGRAVACRKK